MPFGLPLRTERIPGTDKSMVLRPYKYIWPRKSKVVIVPAGYETDFASIPKWVLPVIIDNKGRINDAAVPHDYGYTDLAKQGWSKADVDLMFRDAMIEAKLARWRAYIGWLGVRANFPRSIKWGKDKTTKDTTVYFDWE
jgi:hypothetical protein